MNAPLTSFPDPPAGWRFKVGITLFASGISAWTLIPLEAALGMSADTLIATTVAIAVANKIIFLFAVVVMGKAGFGSCKTSNWLKLVKSKGHLGAEADDPDPIGSE